MKIAIASSGLGHVSRGVETWANDTALALKRAGQDVELFQGSGSPAEDWRHELWCWRRFDINTQRILAVTSKMGGWRYGFGTAYQIEQTTFALSLWGKIRASFDVLHLQDPWTGLLLEYLNRAGLSKPKVILANATDETPTFLRHFSNLQLLTPSALDAWEVHRRKTQTIFFTPYFVDTQRFHSADRTITRSRFNLPTGILIVLCVAAIKRRHKRIDYLLEEFKHFLEKSGTPALLVVAGARETDTDELRELGATLLGDNVRFYENLPRERVADLFSAADLFVLPSLHEIFGIVLIEALASGLPVCCNDTEIFRWIAGPAGYFGDLSIPGALSNLILCAASANPGPVRALAENRAHSLFSAEVVVAQFVKMYETVLA